MDSTNYEQTTIGEIVPTNDDDNTNDEYDNQQVLEEDNHPSYDFPPSSSLVIASTSNDNTTTDCQFPDDCQEQLKNGVGSTFQKIQDNGVLLKGWVYDLILVGGKMKRIR